MRSAAVGHQCVECVDEGARSVRQATTTFGGKPSKPFVTYVLIAVNVVMFALEKALPNVYEDFVLWPAGIAAYDEYYRLFTSAFLHVDVMHIVFNMWALYVTGPALEHWLGRSRFVAVYLLSALGGSVLVYQLTPIDTGTLGASGAIFGLFGATLVLARKLNFDVKWIVGLIVINLVITFVVPSISWQGHIGGLVTGAAIGWAYGYAPRAYRTLTHVAVIVGLLIVFAAAIWLRTASLLNGAVYAS